MSKRALVTGGSSGIGREVAKELASRGYTVYATSRNPGDIDAAQRIPGVTYLALDLASYESIEECAREVGDIDVLVNNAGESQSGPLEELPMDAIDRLFKTNVFGAVRLTQLVLPAMRARRSGRVVMVGSMLASFPLVYRGSYVASKAALKGFAEAARLELTPFGVHIITVEPGSIATGIGTRRTKYIAENSVYRNDFDTMIDRLDSHERNGIDPRTVAKNIADAVEEDTPRAFYAVGSNAPIVFTLKRLLPVDAMLKIIARKHGLRR